MSSIAAKFDELKSRSEKALVLYITAGDPNLDDMPAILATLVEGGADIIEIGMPFSDPIADGPVIQASTQRALDRGVSPTAALRKLGEWDKRCPLVAMGYYNTVLRLGLTNAANSLGKAGIDGTILSDLTPEESEPWQEASGKEGLDTIFLAAPTSTDARLDHVAQRASGFIYAVSRTGVTGAAHEVPPEAKELVQRIRARSELPICVGFGISKSEHVRMIAEVADGVVVGSWLVNLLHEKWLNGRGRNEIIDSVSALKQATR